jgi:hypothetical protein
MLHNHRLVLYHKGGYKKAQSVYASFIWANTPFFSTIFDESWGRGDKRIHRAGIGSICVFDYVSDSYWIIDSSSPTGDISNNHGDDP